MINSLHTNKSRNNIISTQQTGEAVVTASGLAARLEEELAKAGKALEYRRSMLAKAEAKHESRMAAQWRREIASYEGIYRSMTAKLFAAMAAAEAEKAQRYIDGTMNSQDETTADDVLAKYDGQDLS